MSLKIEIKVSRVSSAFSRTEFEVEAKTCFEGRTHFVAERFPEFSPYFGADHRGLYVRDTDFFNHLCRSLKDRLVQHIADSAESRVYLEAR